MQDRADQRHVEQFVEPEEARLQAVINIVVVVGDVVGDGRDLGLGRGPAVQPQAPAGVELADHAPGRAVQFPGHRAIVLDDPFQRFPGQVQALEVRIAMLQLGHDPKGLDVVVEPAPRLHALVELVLSGVAKGRMAEIVRQGDGLGQVVVEAERRGDRPGDLGDLQRMGQAGAVVVAFVGHEDLGLLLQPPKSRAVDDAVTVAGEGCAGAALRLRVPSPLRGARLFGIGGARRRLKRVRH